MTDDKKTPPRKDCPERAEQKRRAKEHTVAGGALGAMSLGSLAVFGSIACPLCIVAAPALVCSGLYNAHKARKGDGAQAPGDAEGTDGDPGVVICRPSQLTQ